MTTELVSANTEARRSIPPRAQAAIKEAVKKGRNRSTAARLAYINPSVLETIMNEAESTGNKHPLYYFAREVHKLEAEYEADLQDMLEAAAREAGPRAWTAYMTILERRFRKNWVQPTAKAEVAGNVQIGHVEKMAIINGTEANSLPSGD